MEFQGNNIVKIESNPNIRPTIKVQSNNIVTSANGTPVVTTTPDGKKVVRRKFEDVENMTRLPGTMVLYCAELGRNGMLKTGLNEPVPNPYADESSYRPGWESVLKGKKFIRRQEFLEYKHNQERGYYNNKVVGVRNSYKVDSEGSFFEKAESRVPLKDGITYLDLDNPIHELHYYMLRAHSKVANSYTELATSPEATHYIVNEQEVNELKTASIRRKNSIGRILEELYENKNDDILTICKALQLANGIKDRDKAYEQIDAYARQEDDSAYKELKAYYEMSQDRATRERFLAYAEFYDFITTPDLLISRNNKIFWNKPSVDNPGMIVPMEWKSKEDFVDNFLVAPQYREEVEYLRSLYQAKKVY